MKIIIIGATGTLGSKITADLEKDHEVIKVGTKTGDLQADITDPKSIKELFEKTGPFDALVSAAGGGHFGPLTDMTTEDFMKGVNSKMMGQINLVLIGQHYIKPKGSFTLITGVLSEDPVKNSVNLAAVNSAVNGFVKAAALELENGVRINAISPGVVEDSPELFGAFPGHKPVSMERVVYAYKKSVLGHITGQVIREV
jgi:NAD(P)-dependent dehydrogenase (short-subunit alcohol dehydrogenase family)